MTHELTLFGTSAVFIGLRAFQQLNVQHDRFWWVPPTTAMMALVEMAQILIVVKENSLWSAVPIACGGILGCWASMYYHRRLRQRSKNGTSQ